MMSNNKKRDLKRLRKLAVFKRDGFRCLYCDREVTEDAVPNDGNRATIDHVWPQHLKNSTNSPRNLMTACFQCNTQKKGVKWDEFCRKKGFDVQMIYKRLMDRRETRLKCWYKISKLKEYIGER